MIGAVMEVCEGSGLDSGRIGVVVSLTKLPTKQTSGGIIPDLPGHYRPFEPGVASVLRDTGTGELFTMFDDRLSCAQHN